MKNMLTRSKLITTLLNRVSIYHINYNKLKICTICAFIPPNNIFIVSWDLWYPLSLSFSDKQKCGYITHQIPLTSTKQKYFALKLHNLQFWSWISDIHKGTTHSTSLLKRKLPYKVSFQPLFKTSAMYLP